MPPRDVCYPYRFNYSWMYSFATKRTFTHPMAKYGPPPRSLVGSPASWAGELEGDRAHESPSSSHTCTARKRFSSLLPIPTVGRPSYVVASRQGFTLCKTTQVYRYVGMRYIYRPVIYFFLDLEIYR